MIKIIVVCIRCGTQHIIQALFNPINAALVFLFCTCASMSVHKSLVFISNFLCHSLLSSFFSVLDDVKNGGYFNFVRS